MDGVELRLEASQIEIGQATQVEAQVWVDFEGNLPFAEPTAPPQPMEVTFIALPEGIVQFSAPTARTDRGGISRVEVTGLSPGDAMIVAGAVGEYSARPVYIHVVEATG